MIYAKIVHIQRHVVKQNIIGKFINQHEFIDFIYFYMLYNDK